MLNLFSLSWLTNKFKLLCKTTSLYKVSCPHRQVTLSSATSRCSPTRCISYESPSSTADNTPDPGTLLTVGDISTITSFTNQNCLPPAATHQTTTSSLDEGRQCPLAMISRQHNESPAQQSTLLMLVDITALADAVVNWLVSNHAASSTNQPGSHLLWWYS